MLSEIPGPKGLPLVGMAPAFFKDAFAYAASLPQHGDVVRVPFPGQSLVYLLHPSLLEQVLQKEAKRFVKGDFIARSKLLFGNGLVVSEGELWLRQRRLMAPAFHPGALRGYAPVLAQTAAEGVAELAPAPGEDPVVIDLDEVMLRLTMRMVLRVLFGTDMGVDHDRLGAAFTEISAYFASAQALLPVPSWVPTPAHVRFGRAMRDLEEVVSAVISERRGREEVGKDLLGRLLSARDDDGSAMDDAQLHDEVRTLFLAGHETTALVLTFTLFELARNPDWQARAREEALALGRPAGPEDALPVITACADEAMRIWPPVPATMREPIEDVELGGFTIPAGTTLVIPPFIVHRDPRWFPDPLRYDPQRFLDGIRSTVPRFAYMPFGGGPRVCIGGGLAMLEARIVLAELLRSVEVLPAEDGAEMDLVPSITLRPRTAVRVRLRRLSP